MLRIERGDDLKASRLVDGEAPPCDVYLMSSDWGLVDAFCVLSADFQHALKA